MIYLRQSTASQEIPLGHFVDDTDGKTAETALSIANTDIKLWVVGATTLANKNTGGATHISGGIYYCVLDATDTATIGPLVVFVAVSGALAVRLECHVLDEAYYDHLFGTNPPLTPTVAGRTLDVSSGGEAGVDWANVGSPTTTVGLTNTTVGLVANAVTAAVIATGAIDSDALADNAIGARVIASDAFTAAKFAADCLTAAKFANDVTTELQTGLATATNLATLATYVDTEVATIVAAVADIQNRLPAALSGGMMQAILGDGTLSSAKFATGAITATVIADGAIDRATFAVDTGLRTIRSGTLQGASAPNLCVLDAGASALDQFYIGSQIHITGGTGVGQVRDITGYNGAFLLVTTGAVWVTVPDATSTFAILPVDHVTHSLTLASLQADTNDIQARLPAALVSGRMDSSIGADALGMATAVADIQNRLPAALSGGMMQAVLGDGTLSSAKFAAGAINAAAIADGAIDAGAIADGAITAAKLASDCITAAKIAADAITAAKIADGAIDADAIATAAATKIADVVLRRSLASALASSNGDTKAFRTLAGAIAKLVNKVAVADDVLTVYETNDTTALGTQAVTTDPDADPITGVDTA